MSKQFATVAVVARRQRRNIADTVLAVEQVLEDHGVDVVFEDATAGFLPTTDAARRTLPRKELGEASDLVVVVGGDVVPGGGAGPVLGWSSERVVVVGSGASG